MNGAREVLSAKAIRPSTSRWVAVSLDRSSLISFKDDIACQASRLFDGVIPESVFAAGDHFETAHLHYSPYVPARKQWPSTRLPLIFYRVPLGDECGWA